MNGKVGEGRPRRSISSAKQSRCWKMCSIIWSDVPRNSIDKDIHYERTKQMGAGKYLRKICYHRIECSTTNSLTALMRK